MLLLAGVLFPLPWIEVSCQDLEGQRKVLFTQSGLESIYAGASVGPALGSAGKVETQDVRPAPLMGVYAFGLLAGMTAGLVFAPGRRRLLVVSACLLVATLSLLLQTLLQFPFTARTQAKIAERIAKGHAADEYMVRYTVWYYLSWVALLGSAVALALELRQRTRTKPPGESEAAGIPPSGERPVLEGNP